MHYRCNFPDEKDRYVQQNFAILFPPGMKNLMAAVEKNMEQVQAGTYLNNQITNKT
jgi:hypothetical protein